MRWMTVAWLAIVAVAGTPHVDAKEAAVTLEPATLMRVGGTLRLGVDGRVREVEVVAPEALRAPLETIVRGWRLKTIIHPHCTPGTLTAAAFNVVLAEPPPGDADAAPRIDNVMFHDTEIIASGPPRGPAYSMQPVAYDPPSYPTQAMINGVRAKVVVALRVGVDGRVLDAAVLQSALLDADASTPKAAKLVAKFEAAALKAVRRWGFAIRTATGEPLREPFDAIQPVSFLLGADDVVATGQWRRYLRGPRRAPAWGDPVLWRRPAGVADLGTNQLRDHAMCVALESDPAGVPVR